MKRRRIKYGWFLLVLCLGACAGLVPKDENSPYYATPPGSRLILHQDLTIPADMARVYLQRGRVVAAPHTTQSFCRFEVNDVLPVEQTLKADEFIVRKTQMATLLVSMQDSATMAASLGFGEEDSSDVSLAWYLWLDSPHQPNVRRLICGGRFDYPSQARRPSINDIRAQLGKVATLITAGEKTE
jgi:hypothetical protein